MCLVCEVTVNQTIRTNLKHVLLKVSLALVTLFAYLFTCFFFLLVCSSDRAEEARRRGAEAAGERAGVQKLADEEKRAASRGEKNPTRPGDREN